MADDFKINITTTGDPKGAEQVAAALKGVSKAAEENSKSARTLGDDMLTLGSRNNATKDVVEGLDSALKGNAASMFGVAKAAKNLWEIFTVSTPAGRALQLALVGVNTALLLFSKQNEQATETAGATAKEIEAMRDAAEAFNKVRFDKIGSSFDALKAKGESASTFFKRIAELSKSLDDAQLSLELAQLNADTSLSPEEKTKKELRIRDRYAQRGLARDEGAAGEALQGLRNDASAARAKAGATEAERALDAFLVSGLQGQRNDLKGRLNELYDELDAKLQARRNGPLNTAANERDLAAYHAAADPLLAQVPSTFSPQADERLKMLEGRLKESTARAEAAKQAADEAQRKLDVALGLDPHETSTRRALADLGQRERYTSAGVPLPGVRRAPDSDVRALPPVIDSFTLQSMGREQGKTTAQILREYTEAWERSLREELRQADVAKARQ